MNRDQDRSRGERESRGQAGVYFLANDRVCELVIAFLNSFRYHNPDLPLCFIPFDRDTSAVAAISRGYGASLFSDLGLLEKCDAISRQLHGQVVGHYRKIAAWEGPFDDFLYIDIDTVVLAPLDFVFSLLRQFHFIASHSNGATLERWVWRPTVRRTAGLSEKQIEYSANTGFLASQKGALSVARATLEVSNARRLVPHFNLACQEQAFLNYLIVTSGRRFTSLALLASTGNPHSSRLELWAGRKGAVVGRGTISIHGRPPVLLVHWAGEWQPRGFQRILVRLLRLLRQRASIGRWEIRWKLPYGRLWRYYRTMKPPLPTVRHSTNSNAATPL